MRDVLITPGVDETPDEVLVAPERRSQDQQIRRCPLFDPPHIVKSQDLGVVAGDEIPGFRRRRHVRRRINRHTPQSGDLDHGPSHAGHGQITPRSNIRTQGQSHSMLAGLVQVEHARLQERVRPGTVNNHTITLRDQLPLILIEMNTMRQKRALREQAVTIIDPGVMLIIGKQLAGEIAFRLRLRQMSLHEQFRSLLAMLPLFEGEWEAFAQSAARFRKEVVRTRWCETRIETAIETALFTPASRAIFIPNNSSGPRRSIST